MRQIILSRLFATIVMLLFLTAYASGATLHGDMHLIDGSSYLGVKIQIDNTFKIVKIIQGSNSKQVSFHQIASILDKDGYDVTKSLIGRDSQEITLGQRPKTEPIPEPDSSSKSIADKNQMLKRLLKSSHLSHNQEMSGNQNRIERSKITTGNYGQ